MEEIALAWKVYTIIVGIIGTLNIVAQIWSAETLFPDKRIYIYIYYM